MPFDPEEPFESELRELIRRDAWLMSILRSAREVGPPEWIVGAGVIRNLVWDHLHGYTERTPAQDVDLVYFDAQDLSKNAELAWEARLQNLRADVPWEVKNQAAVHLWYPKRFGYAVPPLESIEAAVATWPETATAVAVRLLADDQLYVVAPFGLTDLFALVLRGIPSGFPWRSTIGATSPNASVRNGRRCASSLSPERLKLRQRSSPRAWDRGRRLQIG